MNPEAAPAQVWQAGTTEVPVSAGVIMGVINVTPDSFSDGGLYEDPGQAIAAGVAQSSQGASLIDVGGESTRPGSEPVDAQTELTRVMPVVEGLCNRGLLVSIDTTKPQVARAAIAAGACVVNDVSAGSEPGMLELVAESGVGVVLMHSKGVPRTMQDNPAYDDVVDEVISYLRSRIEVSLAAGVDRRSIAIDPGIGFGKTVDHNLQLLAELDSLSTLGQPVVLGTSRKSFLGAIADISNPADRDGVTAITTALGFERGARIFRVHEVAGSRAALALAAAIVAKE